MTDQRAAERTRAAATRPAPPRRATAASPANRQPSTNTAAAKRRKRSQRATAGRCIGVGLVCFGLWLMLDANQLYLSAQASPLGARRTVAITILRPLAAVSNALGLSSFVDRANDALGRANGPGGTGLGANFDPTLGPVQGDVIRNLPPLPHRIPGAHIQQFNVVVSPKLAPVPQPTAAHPLEMLDIGDSIGEDLGFGLADEFGGNPLVKLYQAAQVNTGLANPAYYDWPVHLEKFLAQYHPKVVVAMFGGNDATNFIQFNQGVVFGSPLWRTDYGERVAQIMDEVTASGARLLWVGMPIMQDPSFSASMQQLNAVFQHEAQIHPGVTYYSTWKLFSNSAGQYSAYLQTPGGQEVQARYADGVHLAPGGYDLLASALVAPMQQAWHVRLSS
jgi:lysophospholipase L1-like esterase